MKDISMMSPSKVAEQYGGDKRRIAEAMQMGLISPTVGVMAGMFIDRMRGAAAQEQADKNTVAQDVMAERGLASLPVDEAMVPGGEGYAGGGVVAFANRGFVETPGGLNVLADETEDGDQMDTTRARQLVALAKEMYGSVPRGEGYEAAKKYWEGATERGVKDAERQRALAGLSAASALLGTRGPTNLALSAAGKAAAPGLTKAEEVASAAEEAGIKGRAALEDKERAEQIEAIKGGLGMYGKEQERMIAAGKDLRADKYVKRFVAAAKLDPKLKDLPQEVLEQMGEREFLNLSGAALMRGQAAMGNFGVSAGQLERQAFNDARTKVENRIKGDFRLRNRLSKLERDNPQEYEAEITRMVESEIARGPGSSAAPAVAPKKGNAMFPDRSSASSNIPAGAVNMLKADPSDAQRQNFDAVFGAGAAARILGK